MKEKELNKELRERAIAHGLCRQWQEEWKDDWSLDKMMRRFYKGLDFYLKKRFVSGSFIKKNFPIDYRRKNGLLVDDTYSLVNPSEAILIGDSTSTIRINNTNTSNIYVTDKSKLKVIAKNRAFVIVHMLDSSSVGAEAYDSAKLIVIQHANSVHINANEQVEVKREFDYLR